MHYLSLILSTMFNIINIDRTIFTFYIFTKTNSFSYYFRIRKFYIFFPTHKILHKTSSLYSDAQHYPTVSVELLLELMVRLELTAY